MKDESISSRIPKLPLLVTESGAKGMTVAEVGFDFAEVHGVPFNASLDSLEQGCSSLLDSHEAHEIWFIAEGEGELLYNNQPLRVTAGDVLYFEPCKTHQIHNDSAKAIVFFSIWWRN